MKSMASVVSRLQKKQPPTSAADLQTLSPIKDLFNLPANSAPTPSNNTGVPETESDFGEVDPISADSGARNSTEPAGEANSQLKGPSTLRQFINKLQVNKTVTAGERPIRVIIGFLADVGERDALEYAMGVCEKLFDQLSITFYDVFPYDGGFVYEIQEGGPGRAYTPLVIDSFKKQGPFDPTTAQAQAFLIPTGTRHVEVIRLRSGLSALILPESYVLPVDSEVVAPSGHIMTPAFNQRTGLLAVSASLFAVSFFAFVVAALVQRQPYEPPPPVANEKISFQMLPSSQWTNLVQQAQAGKTIKALRYANGKWQPLETQ